MLLQVSNQHSGGRNSWPLPVLSVSPPSVLSLMFSWIELFFCFRGPLCVPFPFFLFSSLKVFQRWIVNSSPVVWVFYQLSTSAFCIFNVNTLYSKPRAFKFAISELWYNKLFDISNYYARQREFVINGFGSSTNDFGRMNGWYLGIG